MASVIVPAHDEESVIARLLHGLVEHHADRLEIIVVANGCSDETVAAASSVSSIVRVVEITEPSKRLALARGDAEATVFPRIYVDADVEISGTSIEALVLALSEDGVEAAAPQRIVPEHGVSLMVRWYYDVWERLPQVRSGLFGRGVIALSRAGNTRVRALPAVMGDDLAASDAFGPDERVVVPNSMVTVWPPRNLRDLMRRRVRVVTGNVEADQRSIRRPESITRPKELWQIARREPFLVSRIPVFLGVAVASRILAQRAIRRGDTDTWPRDESSRTARPG